MRFQNRTNSKLLREACIFAHYHFEHESQMMQEIRKKNDFRYNSGSGEEIFEKVCNTWKAVDVFTYRPLNPLTKAVGKWEKGAIHANIYKLPKMLLSEVVANLVHEYFHALGYNHGTGPLRNYKTEEKCLYSVPYFASEGISNGRWS